MQHDQLSEGTTLQRDQLNGIVDEEKKSESSINNETKLVGSNEDKQGNTKYVSNEKDHTNFSLKNINSRNPKVIKAQTFLRHPSIIHLPVSTKDDYLLSKGLLLEEVEAAKGGLEDSSMENAWLTDEKNNKIFNAMNRGQDNVGFDNLNNDSLGKNMATYSSNPSVFHPNSYAHQKSSYNISQNNNPVESTPNLVLRPPQQPNPIVPITIGGFLSIFCMATVRWLNGGDFVFFPIADADSRDNGLIGEVMDIGSETSCVEDRNTIASETKTETKRQFDGDIEESQNVKDASDETLPQDQKRDHHTNEEVEKMKNWLQLHTDDVHDYDADNFDPKTESKNIFDESTELSQQLKCLTGAIEDHTALHERIFKDQSKAKSKDVTNDLMDLLRTTPRNAPIENEGCRNKRIADVKDKNTIAGHSIDLANRNVVDLSVLVQITEIKCNLSMMTDFLITNKNEISNEDSEARPSIYDENSRKGTTKLDTVIGKFENMMSSLKAIENSFLKESRTNNTVNVVNIDKDTQEEYEKDSIQVTEVEKSHTLTVNSGEISSKIELCTARNEPFIDDQPSVSTRQESGKFLLEKALQYFTRSNTTSQVKECAQMLFLYIMNLSTNPTLPKYQRIYTNTSTFKKKVGNVKGAENVLVAVGFISHRTYLEWKVNEIHDNEIERIDGTNVEESEEISDNSSAIILLKEGAAALSILKTGGKLTFQENLPDNQAQTLEEYDIPLTPPLMQDEPISSIKANNIASFQTPELKDSYIVSPPSMNKKQIDFSCDIN